MSAPVFGPTVKTAEHTQYHVEAIWPCTHDEAHSKPCGMWRHDPFRRYNASAFNDRRDPQTAYDGYGSARGTFDKVNADVAQHPSRLSEFNSPAFSDAAAALAYAERLSRHGELAAKYDNMTHIANWRERHSRAIAVRVVEERMAMIVRTVTGVS